MENQLTDRFGNLVPEWYHGYVKDMSNRNFMEILTENLSSTVLFLKSIPSEKENFAYTKDKWTIKEVVLHFIDAERIFACRALCFARKDKNNLPGFDENEYVPNSAANERSLISIIAEYESVRKSTIELFKNFNEDMLKSTGMANNYTFSVDLTGIIIAGHELHHLKVIRERYL